MNNEQPLVSVVVATYNSAKTVLETLDSISQQTYKNIELIVSDDGSKDGTVDIVERWLNVHNDLFVHSKLLTVEKNTGTVKNLNRAVKASKGSWIKSIAGDDCLEPFAIERYLAFVNENSTCQMVMSDLKLFTASGEVPQKEIEAYEQYVKKASEPLQAQKKRVIKELVFTGPSWFFARSLYDIVGGFDEDYILMEEWPFVYNVLMTNNRIFVQHEKLVKYRISESSVCRTKNGKGLINKTLFLDDRKFFYRIRLWLLLKNFNLKQALRTIIGMEKAYINY